MMMPSFDEIWLYKSALECGLKYYDMRCLCLKSQKWIPFCRLKCQGSKTETPNRNLIIIINNNSSKATAAVAGGFFFTPTEPEKVTPRAYVWLSPGGLVLRATSTNKQWWKRDRYQPTYYTFDGKMFTKWELNGKSYANNIMGKAGTECVCVCRSFFFAGTLFAWFGDCERWAWMVPLRITDGKRLRLDGKYAHKKGMFLRGFLGLSEKYPFIHNSIFISGYLCDAYWSSLRVKYFKDGRMHEGLSQGMAPP